VGNQKWLSLPGSPIDNMLRSFRSVIRPHEKPEPTPEPAVRRSYGRSDVVR
jgi:hypothetical protein